MDAIKIGLCGLGTVGTGVINVLQNHKERIQHKLGCKVEIKRILVQDPKKERTIHVDHSLLTTNPKALIEDEEIDIIVEVMGGVENTNEFVEEALKSGKHIVTANKDLMALHGLKLLRIAKENKCDIFYDASIAGGIPIVRTVDVGLASDQIEKVMGIVNGTTNFILTKMTDEGQAYETVLEEAQKLGFAESNPSSDVDGLDAARKIALLANLAFKMEVELADVSVRGIREVTQEDISIAKELDYTVKLIGIASMEDMKVEVSVEPTLLPSHHPLSLVKNEYNAVYVYGAAVGETMFYGPGAGSLPTATAVVSDLMEVVKNIRLGSCGQTAIDPQHDRQLKDDEDKIAQRFIRLHIEGNSNSIERIKQLFLEDLIGIEKLLQLPLEDNHREIAIVTDKISQIQFIKILDELEKLNVVTRIDSHYRLEG